MEFTVIKNKNKISVYENEKEIKFKDKYCILVGNIYNLDELKKFSPKLTDEDKLIELYEQYNDDLFKKLNGEFIILLIINGKIILARDRMGSKLAYYGKLKDTFICSTSLKYFTEKRKKDLTIDKQILANYLCYCYIQEPNTIFENIYKLEAGHFITVEEDIINTTYYNLIEEYKKNRNTINNEKKAETLLENSLKNSVFKRIDKRKKIGVFFSAGIDSTLVASLAKSYPKKEINTYTIGFYEEERNEAVDAKKIAEFLKVNYHEFYLDHESAFKYAHLAPKIYHEPFADPSLIPILFLNNKVDKENEIILTGDGADQLFCGSVVYDKLYSVKYIRSMIINFLKSIRYRKKMVKTKKNLFISRKYVTSLFYDIEPVIHYEIPNVRTNKQIRYMLFDIKTFLTNRLFSKSYFPAMYHNLNVAHPFIDNDVINTTLKINHRFKYNKGEKKYILKNILYKRVPKDLLNQGKKGFGIPLKKWLCTIYKDDIVKLSNPDILKKQGLFPVEKITKEIKRLQTGELNHEECYVLFSYYMFQLWYQEHIENLWK